jgi:hypothetical protein
MEVKTILDTYKRYLRTLNCSDAELFSNFKKITDFINDNCEDDELSTALYFGCIGKNLNEIRKRNLRIIDFSNGDWDSEAVKQGYRLIDNIKKYDLFIDPDAYKVNSYRFWELALAQSPYLQLFLCLCFADRLGLHRLFAVSMKEIEEAAQKASELEEIKQTAQSPTE